MRTGISPSSLDLNPLDYSLWAFCESKVSASEHQSLNALKQKLTSEWNKIPQEVIRATCQSFPKRLQQVIDKNGGHIE